MKRKTRWTYVFNNKVAPCNFTICPVLITHEYNGFSYCVLLDEDGTPTDEFAEISNKQLFKTRMEAVCYVSDLFIAIRSYMCYIEETGKDKGTILYLHGISKIGK